MNGDNQVYLSWLLYNHQFLLVVLQSSLLASFLMSWKHCIIQPHHSLPLLKKMNGYFFFASLHGTSQVYVYMVKTNRAVVNEQWVVHTSCASRNATQRDARTRRSAVRNSHGLRSTRRSIISLHVGIKLHNPTLLLILLQFLVPVSTWIATNAR